MKKFVSCLVVFLFVSSLYAKDLEEQLIAWSVRTEHSVRANDSYTYTQGGTGTIIASDKEGFDVLSCAHVYEKDEKYGKGQITIHTSDKSYSGKLVAFHKKMDLSLTRVKTKDNLSYAKLADEEDYTPGLKLAMCSFPSGERSIHYGRALDDVTTSDGYTNLTSSVRATYGSSGGGVFRVSDAKLVGVVWGGIRETSRAVRIDDIHEFLKKASKK